MRVTGLNCPIVQIKFCLVENNTNVIPNHPEGKTITKCVTNSCFCPLKFKKFKVLSLSCRLWTCLQHKHELIERVKDPPVLTS